MLREGEGEGEGEGDGDVWKRSKAFFSSALHGAERRALYPMIVEMLNIFHISIHWSFFLIELLQPKVG